MLPLGLGSEYRNPIHLVLQHAHASFTRGQPNTDPMLMNIFLED